MNEQNNQINNIETNQIEPINNSMTESISTQNDAISEQELPQEPSNIPEIEDTFVEPKNTPTALIVIIICLLLIGGLGALYYFVLDNPKTVFGTISNKVLSKVNINQTDSLIDYTLDVNLTSQDEKIKPMLDIINQVKLEGTIGNKSNMTILGGIINYKEENLLDYGFQIDAANNTVYTKLEDLYDKVLKIDLSSNKEIKSTNIDVSKGDYEQVISSLKTAIKDSLETAEYNKEITKLDNKYVKKMTLIIDESFITNVSNKLLQDSKFMDSCAKINNITTEQLSDNINKSITEAKNNNESISLYLSLLKNDFLKAEYIGGDDSATITKDDNTYNYNISKSYTTKYEGSIKISEVGKKKIIVATFTSVDDKITANIDATYNINEKYDLFDTSNAVNYESLSEEENAKIGTEMMENKALMTLLSDLRLIETETTSTTSTI